MVNSEAVRRILRDQPHRLVRWRPQSSIMIFGLQYHRHLIMNVEHFRHGFDYDYCIAVAPFIDPAPKPSACSKGLIGDADPGADYEACGTDRLGQCGQIDQLESVTSHKSTNFEMLDNRRVERQYIHDNDVSGSLFGKRVWTNVWGKGAK